MPNNRQKFVVGSSYFREASVDANGDACRVPRLNDDNLAALTRTNAPLVDTAWRPRCWSESPSAIGFAW